ncbi:MAG TPA: hypothetical protein VFA43_08370 [Gemmatimonadaceae bacterium]|nr:hypothetical protein [Gemmatimonadaceae bacterium]
MPRAWRRILGVAIGVLFLALAFVLALLTPYWLARWVEATSLLGIAAVLVFALVAGVGLRFATRRRWSSLAVLTAGFATWVYVVLVQPIGHVAPVVPFENTRYWRLSTGSRIAYSEFDPPAGVAVRPVACKGDSAALPADLAAAAKEPNLGLNPYVLQEIAPETEDSSEDPHAALRQNATPAILLYPECNYLSWDGALEYRRTFPHLRIFYFPHAGHYIQFEQAELPHRVMRAFLLDEPDAMPPDTVDADPRLGNKPT